MVMVTQRCSSDELRNVECEGSCMKATATSAVEKDLLALRGGSYCTVPGCVSDMSGDGYTAILLMWSWSRGAWMIVHERNGNRPCRWETEGNFGMWSALLHITGMCLKGEWCLPYFGRSSSL